MRARVDEAGLEPGPVGRIFPGDILVPREVDEERASFCAEMGLGAQSVIVSSFGYPSVPRPVFGRPDGTHRLPANLDPLAARDPTWWLDDETKAQRDGESDEIYSIRIHLELLARRQVDPESLVFHNPLRDIGLDVRTPAGRARLITYRDGGDDPDLRALVVGPELREVPAELKELPDWPAIVAEELFVWHEAAYQRVADECEALVAAMVGGVAQTLESADFDSAVTPLRSAVARLSTGVAPQASRREVEAALDELLDLVNGFVEDEMVVRGELTLGSATAAEVVAYGERSRSSYELGRSMRSRNADRLVGLLYGDPVPETGERLVEFCHEAWREALSNATLTLAEWRRRQDDPQPDRDRRRAPYGAVPASDIYGDIALPELRRPDDEATDA